MGRIHPDLVSFGRRQHGARAERAARNMVESLPFFLVAAILTVVFEVEQPLRVAGPQMFFLGRLAYVCALHPLAREDLGFLPQL